MLSAVAGSRECYPDAFVLSKGVVTSFLISAVGDLGRFLSERGSLFVGCGDYVHGVRLGLERGFLRLGFVSVRSRSACLVVIFFRRRPMVGQRQTALLCL